MRWATRSASTVSAKRRSISSSPTRKSTIGLHSLMSAYTVLLDANVLYPAPIRDILSQFAVTDLYRTHTTGAA